jgi:hypothetical protein
MRAFIYEKINFNSTLVKGEKALLHYSTRTPTYSTLTPLYSTHTPVVLRPYSSLLQPYSDLTPLYSDRTSLYSKIFWSTGVAPFPR